MDINIDPDKLWPSLIIIFIFYLVFISIWIEITAYIGDKLGIAKFFIYIGNKILIAIKKLFKFSI